ncbi:MAG: alpha-mannosidase [Planctomycetes bacterium]|nr:alpha-mannosidase [Planctomycetota bacterium]
MIGIGDHDYLAIRFEAFADDVLGPAIHAQRHPLDVAVYQPAEPVPLATARRAAFTPVAPGFRWGPVWSTAWFRIRGTVPATMAGRRVALRFSSGTEALLWQRGEPRQGFDDNRDACVLYDSATGGEEVDLLVEAACNHPFGVSTFFWDPPEQHRRWRDEKPGRLERCELVTVDEDLWRLRLKLHFARQVLLELPAESARAHLLARGLRLLLADAPATDPHAFAALEPRLDELLRGNGAPAATHCTAVGHAHLDTAWLWPLRETRRKLLRSWSNVLELMDRFDGFCFVASQAQQYAFVEQDSPELFERIRRRVADGRWEAGGAMWVEPDCSVPSGESLVRQILHGTRYWQEKLGPHAQQRHLYLPDTFGFPACLPQLATLGGLDTFLTNKLAWCDRNDFPHTTFLWRGIDGTELLTHFTPGDDYNAQLAPKELARGERKLIRKDLREMALARCTTRSWLQPFGFGDGGGGPTAEMIARARFAGATEGMPQVELGRMDAFCERLHRERDAARAAEGRDLPVWDGELYLEMHRGTTTSAAWLKRANADAENRLRRIEALLAGAGDAALRERWVPRLRACWRSLLLHQFHDILPGSSIAAVYDDARRALAELDAELRTAERETLAALAARFGAHGAIRPVVVFNPCSHARSGYADVDGRPCRADDVPPLGAVLIDAAATAPVDEPVRTTATSLANGYLTATIDTAGRVAALTVEGADAPVNARVDAPGSNGSPAPLNQLVAYEDRPRRWEAWDIDFDHTDRAALLDGPAEEIVVRAALPERGEIEVVRRYGRSTIRQRYVLHAGAHALEVRTAIDWQEERTLLRALFPTRIRARAATFGIQFGHLERPTHRNTSWEEARYEVPGRRWMDVAQPGLGLAVLDDGKYGRTARDGTLGLTLLRSTQYPAADLDRGTHEFRYALLPHGGDWRAAEVPEAADELCEPLVAVGLDAASARSDGLAAWRPVELVLPRAGSVEIAALKPAEDGDGVVLRLVERHGGDCPIELRWHVPAGDVRAVDLCERPLVGRVVGHDPTARRTRTTLRPFEILSLLATPEVSP